MFSLPFHASGMSIIITCGSERPACTSNSIALSRLEESDCFGLHIGSNMLISSGEKYGDAKNASLDFSQLMLPCTVLISPLCAMNRNGCANLHDGNVFVENRE